MSNISGNIIVNITVNPRHHYSCPPTVSNIPGNNTVNPRRLDATANYRWSSPAITPLILVIDGDEGWQWSTHLDHPQLITQFHQRAALGVRECGCMGVREYVCKWVKVCRWGPGIYVSALVSVRIIYACGYVCVRKDNSYYFEVLYR